MSPNKYPPVLLPLLITPGSVQFTPGENNYINEIKNKDYKIIYYIEVHCHKKCYVSHQWCYMASICLCGTIYVKMRQNCDTIITKKVNYVNKLFVKTKLSLESMVDIG